MKFRIRMVVAPFTITRLVFLRLAY